MTDLNSQSFRRMVETSPEWAREVVKVAEQIVKDAKKQLSKNKG